MPINDKEPNALDGLFEDRYTGSIIDKVIPVIFSSICFENNYLFWRFKFACKLRANEKGFQALSPETLYCPAPPARLERATL